MQQNILECVLIKSWLFHFLAKPSAFVSALILSTTSTWAASVKPLPAQTRYPIVLVHGLFGFDDILGIDYWYQIPADLRKNGATVLIAKVSALNDNDARGEQLLKQLQEWKAAKGYQKFNLIGHSLGGPTIRYTAGVAPSLVASVTTVGSPHTLPDTGPQDLIGKLLTNYISVATFMGKTIDWLSGHKDLPTDAAALKAWADNTAAFNARLPQGMPTTPCGQGTEVGSNGVRYYSIAGNQPKTNKWDLIDLIMTEADTPSDGLVLVCSAHWGQVLRDDYPWNHLDEINQTFGLIGKGAPDPVAFYREQASRLKNKGL
jgi:triacylglycerol lipase